MSEAKSTIGAQDNTLLGILSNYIEFDPPVGGASNNLAAPCPFHKGGTEKRSSFYLYTGAGERFGSAFCHTCGEGWSFKGLLRKLGASRTEVDTAAASLGTMLYERPSDAVRAKNLSLENMVLPEHILGVFDLCPVQLVRDGFTKETLKAYDIGFDRELMRITFPVRDHLGNLVGISGRTVIGEREKYHIYRSKLAEVAAGYHLDKTKVLWGLDKVYPRVMSFGAGREPLILCEGFKAAMWVVQAGFQNSVAVMGTYLSFEQLSLVQRSTNSAILFLDNDDPGRKGTSTIIKSIGRKLPGLRIADYGARLGASPDDLSPEQVRTAVQMSIHPLQWSAQYECS